MKRCGCMTGTPGTGVVSRGIVRAASSTDLSFSDNVLSRLDSGGPVRTTQRDSTMPSRYFELLCDLLKADGVDVDAMLREAGLGASQIYEPGAMVTVAQFEALFE